MHAGSITPPPRTGQSVTGVWCDLNPSLSDLVQCGTSRESRYQYTIDSPRLIPDLIGLIYPVEVIENGGKMTAKWRPFLPTQLLI